MYAVPDTPIRSGPGRRHASAFSVPRPEKSVIEKPAPERRPAPFRNIKHDFQYFLSQMNIRNKLRRPLSQFAAHGPVINVYVSAE